MRRFRGRPSRTAAWLAAAVLFSLTAVRPAFSVVADAAESGGPQKVRAAVQLDQITDVNQREENFTIVGNLILAWADPAYAFSEEECGCTEKVFSDSQFEDFVRDGNLRWPRFVFYNQQGKRWAQEKMFQIFPDGRALYFERFTVTLQAPDFNFLKYPFDTQQFALHILSVYRDSVYVLVPDRENSRVGEKLGEEEWQAGVFTMSTAAVDFGDLGSRSQAGFGFSARRHLSYYLSRIFLPLLLIISVAYATFFMKDYAKRVDYSAANLLTFVMFNFAIGSDLPRLGYLTFVDSIVVLGFVITAVTVIANVVQKRLSVTGREETARKWDHAILFSYPALYIFGLGLSFILFFR